VWQWDLGRDLAHSVARLLNTIAGYRFDASSNLESGVSVKKASVDRQTSLFVCSCRWFVALLHHRGAIWWNAVGVLACKLVRRLTQV